MYCTVLYCTVQDLSVSEGADRETAVRVCGQYGARLLSTSELQERPDLLDHFREERRDFQCSQPLGYWLREGFKNSSSID